MGNQNAYTLLLHFGSPPNNPRNSTGGSCFRCAQADTGIITNTRRITDCATQGSCELLLARMRSPKPLTLVRCQQLAPGQGSPKQMPLGEAVPTLKGSEHLGWMLRGSTLRHRTVSVSVVMLTETTGTVATGRCRHCS